MADTSVPRAAADGLAAERVGEIVAASSRLLVAQSVRLHEPPPFGSLVRVPVDAWPAVTALADGALAAELYAVVAEARTASLEAGGRPIARGRADVFDAAIYRENPDLEHVLRTEFDALLVGFRAAGAIRQHLPPFPPPLHYSVYACEPAAVLAFTEQLDYLRTLVTAEGDLADELVAAHARWAAGVRGGDARAFLVRVGRELAMLLRDDYERLTAVLRRLRPEEAAP